ncbi:MAG TPA: ABC transporter permease [Sulfolobales archaeon]|nr:ABC transporter permease [Sulfolobales archaeon]
MVSMRSLRSLLWLSIFNGYIPMRNNPLWVVSSFLSPFSFFFLILIIGRHDAINYALIGGLVLSMASSTFGLLGDIVWYRSSLKLQEMFLATPTPYWAYVLGLALSAYIWGSPSIAGFILLLYIFGLLKDILAFIFIVTLTAALWITVSFMVFLISTYIRTERLVWPLASILGLGLSVFPPVYYPVTMLPEPLRILGIMPPTASASLLLQAYSGVISIDPIYIYIAIANLTAQTLLCIFAYALRLRSVVS